MNPLSSPRPVPSPSDGPPPRGRPPSDNPSVKSHSFFGSNSVKSLFSHPGARGSAHDPSKHAGSHFPHLPRSESDDIRHRNSAKLDSLIHQYHLRDSEVDSHAATAFTEYLKDSRSSFHVFLTLVAVYVGTVVPWTGAFKDSKKIPLLRATIYVR